MHDYTTQYRLCGVTMPRSWYRRLGRLVPERLRDVRSVPSQAVSVLPAPGDWNAAVQHSLDNPAHILGPYEDPDGQIQMCCDGSGDPNEPSNCNFDTASLETPA